LIFKPLFTEHHTFDFELTLTPKFSVKFILMGTTYSCSAEEAFIARSKFRDNLRVRFPGITIRIYAKYMMPNKSLKHFWEIKLL